MEISQTLQKLMKEHGLSSSKLARELGVHTSTVSNWLNGKEIKLDNLNLLCEYFGCSLDYFSPGLEEKEKAPLVNNDPELTEYLEELRTRPEMKMLFRLTSKATKEDVEKAVKIIEAYLGK